MYVYVLWHAYVYTCICVVLCICQLSDMVLVLSALWDRAPKDLHRRHNLFKGVFPIPQRKPSKEMGQFDRKITGVTCGARTWGGLWLPEYMSGAQKPHATGPGYLSVELVGYYLWFLSDLWDRAQRIYTEGIHICVVWLCIHTRHACIIMYIHESIILGADWLKMCYFKLCVCVCVYVPVCM